MKTLSSSGDRAVEREAHRRDLPTPVPYGPRGEQLLSVAPPTWQPGCLEENIRDPAVSDFRARDTPRQAKAQEPEKNHSCSVRDKGQTLHPSAAPRRQVLIAQSLLNNKGGVSCEDCDIAATSSACPNRLSGTR